MTQERETLLEELAAVMTNTTKALKLTLRFIAHCTRLVEAGGSAPPDVEALREEQQALFREVDAIVRDLRESLLKMSACYEGFTRDSRTTPEEVEAVSQGASDAGRGLLMVVWALLSTMGPPELGERFDAIMARTAGASRGELVKAVAEFIDELLSAVRGADAAAGGADRSSPTDPA